jgi:hypothetical protein
MSSSIKRSGTKALITSAAVMKVAPTRNLYSSRRPSPSSATESDSCWEGDLSTETFSDTYSDPDTEADTDVEPSTSEDAGPVSERESEPDLDSEVDEIFKDIVQLRAEGPAKPNHTKHTTKLWKREGEFWER